MGKNINGDRPTAFPLEQEKLNFTIPVTDQPREKVAKLVQTITDRVPVKLKGVKGQRPRVLGPCGDGDRRDGGWSRSRWACASRRRSSS